MDTYDKTVPTPGMDQEALRHLGNMVVAYVKPAVVESVPGFAIHGADGAMIGFAPTVAHAIVAIRENGMEPVSIH